MSRRSTPARSAAGIAASGVSSSTASPPARPLLVATDRRSRGHEQPGRALAERHTLAARFSVLFRSHVRSYDLTSSC